LKTYENIESENLGKGNAGKVLAPMFHKHGDTLHP